MTKIIELTELVVTKLDIDYDQQVVVAHYKMMDAEGVVHKSGLAYFWVTIPAVPPDIPVPDNWFQLPSSYFPTLLQLQTDADTALTTKFLI